jgi:hypothetical protein
MRRRMRRRRKRKGRKRKNSRKVEKNLNFTICRV